MLVQVLSLIGIFIFAFPLSVSAVPHNHSTALKKSQVNKLLNLEVGEKAIVDIRTAAGKARLVLRRKADRQNPVQLVNGVPSSLNSGSELVLFNGRRKKA